MSLTTWWGICSELTPSALRSFRGRGCSWRWFLFLLLGGLLLPSPSPAEVYKYVNKDGVVSYTDSLQAVPEKYRSKATAVKGLREQDERPADKAPADATTLSPKHGSRQAMPQQEQTPARQRIEENVRDFRDKGYWKPVGIILVLIVVFFLMGKAGGALGHKGVWTVLRVLVVLGLLSYFLYAYTDEMSGVYGSLSEKVYNIKGRIDKRHVEENRQQNEVFQDNKRQGEKK